MKVYIVECWWDYEGSDVMAVLPTKEEADAVADKYRGKEFSYDNVSVTEWEVGEITDRRWEEPEKWT